MKLLKWQEGRQGTGYEVLTLINSKLLKFDLHILRYKEGSYIPKHTDPAKKGYEHHRLNIEIKKAEVGGHFWTSNLFNRSGRINLFRPDITPHGVAMVIKGTRYVLSMGWLKKAK